jgi:hypothetical protein
MGNLKNYEIESLVNLISKRIREGKEKENNKVLEEFKSKNKDLLKEYKELVGEVNNGIEEVRKIEEKLRVSILEVKGIKLGMGDFYGRGLLNEGSKVKEVVSIDFQVRNEVIKDEVVVKNMDGDVSKMMDELVEKFRNECMMY